MRTRTILLASLAAVLMFGAVTLPANAATFFDDFNDGNANGWWLGYSLAFPQEYGNWRVEDEQLVQDSGWDGVIALVKNIPLTDQIVETQLKLNGPAGYGGIVLWFQDDDHGVFVQVYPAAGYVETSEVVDGNWYVTHVPYSIEYNDAPIIGLKVDADSVSGDMDIYVDGAYLFTYTVRTPYRTGQSGLFNGNSGGSFDNFALTSTSSVDVLANKNQCKAGGWKMFRDPTFTDQGSCVSYVESSK